MSEFHTDVVEETQEVVFSEDATTTTSVTATVTTATTATTATTTTTDVAATSITADDEPSALAESEPVATIAIVPEPVAPAPEAVVVAVITEAKQESRLSLAFKRISGGCGKFIQQQGFLF